VAGDPASNHGGWAAPTLFRNSVLGRLVQRNRFADFGWGETRTLCPFRGSCFCGLFVLVALLR